jgi:hypothetical protein
MYTALDHDLVIASFEWLLDKHFYRRHGVCIPKDRDQQPYFSNCATDPDNNGFFLTKAGILAVIKFDLANIFFVCRGQLLRQIVGIAMGSPGIYSPAAAILGCMDDLLSFVSSILRNVTATGNARNTPVDPAQNSTQYLMTLFHFYDTKLKMEIETAPLSS